MKFVQSSVHVNDPGFFCFCAVDTQEINIAYRAKCLCNYPGCGALIEAPGYCVRHALSQESRRRTAERLRLSSRKRGYGSRWEKLRRIILHQRPLCVLCEKRGRITAATVVDHIVAHKGDSTLFWALDNLQPLCASCHSTKTASQDGGYGNPSGTGLPG